MQGCGKTKGRNWRGLGCHLWIANKVPFFIPTFGFVKNFPPICLHQSARSNLRLRRAREIVASWLEATIVELEVDEATTRERLLKRESGVGENHYPAGVLRRRLLHRNGNFVPPAP